MLKIPRMLMVGSTGRRSGKTRFVCSLISRFGSKHNIVGIKVTAVQKANGSCPRGGSGCGVCSSLEGHYYITEETPLEVRTEDGVVPQGDLLLTGRANKDTCRMLAAGAGRVFWLRVLRRHLEEGMVALLDVIGDDAVSVCESNSLRRVVEPGLFVMVKGRGSQNDKASAKDVIRYADRIVIFDGDRFDIDVDEIELIDNRWACKLQATAVIMAGGDSSRMGRDKSMLPIDGQPMIKYIYDQLCPYFNEILISSNDVSKYGFVGVEVIPDEILGRGPLGGIASALRASANELNFVIASDIPKVDIDLMKTLLREGQRTEDRRRKTEDRRQKTEDKGPSSAKASDFVPINDIGTTPDKTEGGPSFADATEGKPFDAVIPRIAGTEYEPLFAVYKRSALKTIEATLLSGNNRIIDALSSCKVRYIDLTETQRLENINTLDDYRGFVGKENDAVV